MRFTERSPERPKLPEQIENRWQVDESLLTVLYLRYSPKPEKVSDSLVFQEEAAAAYCKMRGLYVPPEFIFRDPDVSASKTLLKKRPEGQRMIECLEDGEATNLVAVRMDRIFRNKADGEGWLARWNAMGVTLHLVDQGGCSLNSDTATGSLMLTMILAMSQFESDIIGERVRIAKRSMKARGLMGNSVRYFGWKCTNKSVSTRTGAPNWMEPDDVEQTIYQIALLLKTPEERRRVAGMLNRSKVFYPKIGCKRKELTWHENDFMKLAKNTKAPCKEWIDANCVLINKVRDIFIPVALDPQNKRDTFDFVPFVEEHVVKVSLWDLRNSQAPADGVLPLSPSQSSATS